MAEKAAHLTATSYAKTSIFEIISQDSLNSTIYPALKKFISFLSSYNQQKLGWLTNYYDELYLSLNGFLQYLYIQKHGASFAEYFYGLKRIPAYDSTAVTLNTTQKNLSLIFLVLFPYLNNKLEEKLNIYKLELASGVKSNNWERNLKKLISSGHVFFHIFWKSWKIYQYVTYMCGKTNMQSPALSILSLKLIYADTEDIPGFWSFLYKDRSLPSLNSDTLGQAIIGLAEFGAFFLQFLQSWQTEFRNINVTQLPVPEPPGYDPKASLYKRKCPLCMQSWRNPTVVATSGYVYCFRCIVQHLHEDQYCPVTKQPVSLSDIIRLYDT